MPEYTYVTTNLATGAVLEELPFISVGFAHELNGSGGFEGVLPLEATDSNGYNKINLSSVDAANTEVWILRDGVIIWGGIIWDIRANVENNTLTVAGSDHFSYLKRRHLRQTLSWTATEQLEIFEDLLDHAQAQSGGDIGLLLTYVASGRVRQRNYLRWELKNISEAMVQLAAVEDGFDFYMKAGGTWGAFTKTIVTGYPRVGRATDLVFEVGKNVEMLDYIKGGSGMANSVTGVGMGDGPDTLLVEETNPNKFSRFPLLQRVSAHKTVKYEATLRAHAQNELKMWEEPTEALTVSIIADQVDAKLGSFIVGDEVRVVAERGWISIDNTFRVMRYTVNVDDNGKETVQVELNRRDATL